MTITSTGLSNIGLGLPTLNYQVQNLKTQLGQLQTQLSSGKLSTTYSGMGSNEGFAIAARSQLSDISGFTDTMSSIGTTISVENDALQSFSQMADQVQTAASADSQAPDGSGQTTAQQIASSELTSMLGILNTQAGNRFVFSGSAINTPSVASFDSIINGTTTQAGLKQVISERLQADQGTGTGRLVISSPTPTSVAVAEDASPSPFGMKLAAVSSTLTGATVTGPTGTPASITVDLGATNPNPGDTVNFTFNMPDGSQESIALTATTTNPPPTGSFLIGATSTATATNLQGALTTAITNLSNTSLVAASAMAASQNFFGSPPLRVGTQPFSSATTLVSGAANTVQWYTGDAGPGPARASATARIDQSVTVQYGVRANEQAIQTALQNIAVLAAVTTSPTDPNASAQVAALDSRVVQNLSTPQTGQQTLQDIQTDLANAQTTIKNVGAQQQQKQVTLQSIIDQAENASPDQVASEILALQTSLQASYQTTSMLSELSLVKFLPVPSG